MGAIPLGGGPPMAPLPPLHSSDSALPAGGSKETLHQACAQAEGGIIFFCCYTRARSWHEAISGWRKSMFPYSGRADAPWTGWRLRILDAVASAARASAPAAAVALPLFFALAFCNRFLTVVTMAAPPGTSDLGF